MYLEERRNGESNREYALRILKANIIQMILEPGCPIGEQKIAKELVENSCERGSRGINENKDC